MTSVSKGQTFLLQVEEGDGPLHTDHQLETLRNDIEERDKIIDKLQQAARVSKQTQRLQMHTLRFCIIH